MPHHALSPALTRLTLARTEQLPASLSALSFSNILCGVVRGSLEMVQFKVKCTFASDTLHGHDASEVRTLHAATPRTWSLLLIKAHLVLYEGASCPGGAACGPTA